MAKQLAFELRPGALRFDAGSPIDWRALNRQAARIASSIAAQCRTGARDGFAIRRYANDVTLLNALRRLRAGKHLKREARRNKTRLQVPASVLAMATPAGQKLLHLIDQLEERVSAQEAVTLCG